MKNVKDAVEVHIMALIEEKVLQKKILSKGKCSRVCWWGREGEYRGVGKLYPEASYYCTQNLLLNRKVYAYIFL